MASPVEGQTARAFLNKSTRDSNELKHASEGLKEGTMCSKLGGRPEKE